MWHKPENNQRRAAQHMHFPSQKQKQKLEKEMNRSTFDRNISISV